MHGTHVLLCSVGRRPYLVDWFVTAASRHGSVSGVTVADCDPDAASRRHASEFIVSPRTSEAEYLPWLMDLLDARDVGLAVSVNDHELSVWAHSAALNMVGTRLLRLAPDVQEVVEDKLIMSRSLGEFGLLTPSTWQASEPSLAMSNRDPDGALIVKHRFGSGSVGLHRTTRSNLATMITQTAPFALDRVGSAVDAAEAMDNLVVQELVPGVEYGLDVICDFTQRYVAVLARKKHAMRHGETDKATTVNPAPFDDVARAIARAVPHSGLIDVDVIVDGDGQVWVIDINPRFGGGYPFSHLAGADVPAAYLSWMTGETPPAEWLSSQIGITGAKHVATSVVQGEV